MRARHGFPPRNLRAENLRQAREARRLRHMLDSMGKRIALYVPWLSGDGVWDDLRDACGSLQFGALAAKMGLDPKQVTAREVFLTALSTVSARGMAWNLVLRFSTGDDHAAFLEIWRMEEEVNASVRRIFRNAKYLYRAESVNETIKIHDGTVGPALHYSFVSLSSSLLASIKFAFNDQFEYTGTPVVLVVDAHKARKAGAIPATYSMASDVLDLPRDAEGVNRTFPLGQAHELQAHFPAQWPPGSAAAMVAIITTMRPTPDELCRLEAMGIPTLSCTDIFPQER